MKHFGAILIGVMVLVVVWNSLASGRVLVVILSSTSLSIRIQKNYIY